MPGKLLRGRRLRGKLDRHAREKCGKKRKQARCRRCTGRGSKKSLAMLQWGGRGAEFARAAEVEPRMAFLRRPRKNGPGGAWPAASLKAPMWQHRGRLGRPSPSHIRVIRPAAAFGRNPGDVLIRVLDVAGFAVDAILRVDDEFRRARPPRPIHRPRPGNSAPTGPAKTSCSDDFCSAMSLTTRCGGWSSS